MQQVRWVWLAQIQEITSESQVGTIVVIVVVLVIAAWIYNAGHKSGKRLGSRKGYGVGFDRGKRSRGQKGCLVIIVICGLLAAATSTATALFR
jgi:hypothetical protein